MSDSASAPVPTPVPPPPLVADRLVGFSDRLSPMLVKELRQGLRAKTFVIVFLTLQGLLLLVLLSAVAASAQPQRAGGVISGIIFMFFSMALLVIQPIRGIGTLHREVQGKTIELMVLTRLSAWKIVLGKWVSIVSQSALILAAIVPYLILRYWFGDMNLFGELSLMLMIFLASAVLTAVVVGISCVPSVLLRGLVPLLAGGVGLVVIPQFCFGHEFERLVSIAALQAAGSFWGVVAGGLGALYLGWTALGIGAGMIAPVAENHATLRRLVALGLLLVLVPVAAFAPVGWEPLAVMIMVILVPALVLALTEPFHPLPSVLAPFLRRGPAGALAARVLYPGWPSGVWFSILAIALGMASMMLASDGPPDTRFAVVLVALLGGLLMPAAFTVIFEKRVKSRFTTYLLVLAAGCILSLVTAFIAGSLSGGTRGFLWFFAWLPQSLMVMAGFDGDFDEGALLLTAVAVAAAYLLVLLPGSLRRFREISRVESEPPANE